MTEERAYFNNSRGMKLSGILDLPVKVNKHPAVIICHSFTGYKELKNLFHLGKKLAERGFVALRFDFSDCMGESEGKCEDMMLTHQINDVESAINFLLEKDYVDAEHIGVAGHSLGGITAIATAGFEKRIRALVSIAAPARFDWQKLFDEAFIKKWKEKGITTFPTYKKGKIKIRYSFFEDLKEYDGLKIIKNVTCPIRIIHGDADTLVPLKNAEGLFEQASEPKDLKIVEGAGHMFMKEPYLSTMIELTISWFEQYLKK